MTLKRTNLGSQSSVLALVLQKRGRYVAQLEEAGLLFSF